jgi:hypothetical protein
MDNCAAFTRLIGCSFLFSVPFYFHPPFVWSPRYYDDRRDLGCIFLLSFSSRAVTVLEGAYQKQGVPGHNAVLLIGRSSSRE